MSHVVALAGACCVIAATAAVWLRAELGTGDRSLTGLDVPLLALPVILAAIVVVAVSVVGGVTGSAALRPAATVAGVAVVAVCALVVVVVETVAALLPDALLPAFARDYGVDLSAGPGPWVAMVGGVVMIAGSRGWTPPFVSALTGTARGRRLRRALPAVMLVVATAVFAWLRYQPWLGASAAGASDELTGWSLPWIGPLSLVALVALGGAIGAASVLQLELAGLLAAAGGWLATLSAGLVAQAASAFGRLGLEGLASSSVRAYGPQVEVASGTWMAFGSGLLAAGAGAGLLLLAGGRTEEAPWSTS